MQDSGAASTSPKPASVRPVTSRTCRSLAHRLLQWYRSARRDLPWRRTRDPYAIWISEIMLQQTQVATVIPFWQRWMETLPDIQSLAQASPETVLKLWEGLGYYTRARNLHRAAREITLRHQGRFPAKREDIAALPGIGRYTLGAICSIAFNQPTPVLDGNVSRLLTRLFGWHGDPREKDLNRQLWLAAEALVQASATWQKDHERNCADLNQALMELGALVCLPRQPHCASCPLQQRCVALKNNEVHLLPGKSARPKSLNKRTVAFVVEKRGRFLVRQRTSQRVNSQLWEFPNAEVSSPRQSPSTIARRQFGWELTQRHPILSIHHSITRYRIRLDVYPARENPSKNKGSLRQNRHYTLAQLSKLAFPSAHRRILDHLQSRPMPKTRSKAKRGSSPKNLAPDRG